MLNNIGFVITARLSSNRLPGKVLKQIYNKTCLEHLCSRLKESQYFNKIVIATSTNPEDETIAHEAHRLKVLNYRGSLEDVLDRVVRAAIKNSIDPIVLIGGDRAIQDIEILDYVIEHYERELLRWDCVVNIDEKMNYTFPQGQIVYVISRKYLEEINLQKWDPLTREHLHFIFFGKKSNSRTLTIKAPEKWNRPDIRTAIDTTNDFHLNKKIFDKLYPINPHFSILDVFDFLDNSPEIMKINRNFKHKIIEIFEENLQ